MNHQEQVISDITFEHTQKALDDAISSSNSTSARRLDKLDRGEDFATWTTQEVESTHDFYTQNATVIKSVSDAMVTDISKKSMGDFLGEAKKVMEALDSLQQIHPFVGVAVVAFKAVVNLELRRRENDRKVGLVLGQASDMMIMLLQLKDTTDPAIMGPHGEIRGRLQRVMDGIKQDIEDCGNAIDKYHKSKFMVKFFRSSQWASEFLKICDSFSQRTQDLQLALNIRTTLRVDIVIDKVGELIRTLSEREEKFEKEVQRCGGREKCLESDDTILELQKIAEQQEARPQSTVHANAPSRGINKPVSKVTSAKGSVVEQRRLDASLLYELRTPLRSLLDDNRALFMFKLDTMTSDIKDAIKDSETRIMWAFNNRFRRVKDLHLQYIWKEMKWATSVKTLYFIAELHDYYVNHFSRLRHESPLPQATSDTSSLVLRVPSPTPTISVMSDTEEDCERLGVDLEYHELPTVDPADKWCLKYLTVFYIPSLSESFDSDANGLVSIREVNAFTSTIPSGSSLLQALAYSAAGWRVNSQYYHARIEQILNSMVYAQADALPENRRCIAAYLDSYVIDGIKKLVRSLADLGPEDSDLDLAQLAARRRESQEETLADKLNTVKYEIDSKDSLKLFGSGRIENFLLPLLYLVIRRHLQIMKLASKVILVERELESATQTIENILDGVRLRMVQLAESFRQQGNDPNARFTWYGHGLYNFWYSPERAMDDTEYWETHNFGLDDTELEIDSTSLKLGFISQTEDQELLERPVKLVVSNPRQQPEDPKDEYILLWCMNKLHNHGNSGYPFEIPPYLSSEEQRRFKLLSEELPDSDVRRWNALAELQIRRQLFECQCNACHYLVSGVLYHCLDCESNDYDVCADCESQPVSDHKYPSDHKPTHNMLVFRMSLPYSRCYRIWSYAKNFLSACVPPAALPDAPLTAGQDESQTQSDGTEPHTTEGTQADVAFASVDLREGDEKSSGNSGVAFGRIAGTSVANGDSYVCAECSIKMKGIFYVCLTCGELHTAIALCGDCAFRDVFNVVTEHHPHKHWLVKIKDRVQDAGIGTSDEPVDNVDETTSLSSRVDKLAAMVESRFMEQDLRLSALVTQIDQLVRSLAASTGKAQLPSESVTDHGLISS